MCFVLLYSWTPSKTKMKNDFACCLFFERKLWDWSDTCFHCSNKRKQIICALSQHHLIVVSSIFDIDMVVRFTVSSKKLWFYAGFLFLPIQKSYTLAYTCSHRRIKWSMKCRKIEKSTLEESAYYIQISFFSCWCWFLDWLVL